MTPAVPPSVHASAVLVGARAVLIRGPSGSGKSELAFRLIEAGRTGELPFARLVADDRTVLTAFHGRLLACPVPALRGLLEIRGLGIRRLEYEETAVLGLAVDFGDPHEHRLPRESERTTGILGISLPKIAVRSDGSAFRRFMAWRLTQPFSVS